MNKPRILLAENDPVVALYLASELSATGFAMAASVHDVPQLSSKVASTPFDAALMAVQLGDAYTFDIAAELRLHRKPFAFITAFSRGELPSDLQGVPLIEKPFEVREVVRVIDGLLGIGPLPSIHAAA